MLSFLCSGHPWIRSCQDGKISLDILVIRLVKSYLCSSSLRKAALKVRHIFVVAVTLLFSFLLLVLQIIPELDSIENDKRLWAVPDTVTIWTKTVPYGCLIVLVVSNRSWINDLCCIFLILPCIYLFVPHGSLMFTCRQALAKTLLEDQLVYLREQFNLLGPNKSDFICLQNFRTVSFSSFYIYFLVWLLWSSFTDCRKISFAQALMKYSTNSMKDSRVHDFVNTVLATQSCLNCDFEKLRFSGIMG